MTDAVVPRSLAPAEDALPRRAARQLGARRRLVLTVLAVAVFFAALLVLGPIRADPVRSAARLQHRFRRGESRRSVILTRRNRRLWPRRWWRPSPGSGWGILDLPESTLVVIAGALIALPLALQESAGAAARDRTIVVTKRSLILALWGLVVFVYLYYEYGESLQYARGSVCRLASVVGGVAGVGRPPGRIELGLLRHPLRRDVRAHLVQGLNIWLCCVLLGGVLAAGGMHYARIGFSLNAAQFDVVIAAFAAGLVLLAALALVPRRRVYVATNVVVALLSGFLALQLVQISVPPADAVVLDSPLAGEWFVFNGGRSVLLNGHSPNESNADRLPAAGANGRTHTGGAGAPLDRLRRLRLAGAGARRRADRRGDRRLRRQPARNEQRPRQPPGHRYRRRPVRADGPPHAGQRHGPRGRPSCGAASRSPRSGTTVIPANRTCTCRSRTPRAESDAERTYPMVFRNVHITRGGAWPWGDSRELRTGDLITAPGQ